MAPSERTDPAYDPDRFNRGIAPSVKLLHSVVSRLVDIDISAALDFVRRWKLTNSPIHLRLWAALSRDSRVTSSTDVASTLLALDNRYFWDLDDYPEIAELRAKRFSGLDSDKQTLLTARIRKRPPRSQWPRKADSKHVENARTYRAVRELRRIEIADARLPMPDKTWLDERIPDFPDLAQMVRLQEGFLDSLDANLASTQPDKRYDLLSGKERLEALEAALSSSRSGWADDPHEHATEWIRQTGNPVLILSDFESIPNGGAAFVRVWNRFGWAHVPGGDDDKIQRNLVGESARVLSLLIKLRESTLRDAIEGISQWLSVWEKQVVVQPKGFTVWFKVWPIASEITNAQQSIEEEPHLSKIFRSSDDSEPMDLDTLNTPAGKLVGVFLASCPSLTRTSHPFEVDGPLCRMRDAIMTASARAGLIGRHRMIESLSYFLNADAEWTQTNLITPLIADTSNALALWRAIARKIQYLNVIKIIGRTMAERATDSRLGRETRSSLVFSLLIECLHAFREQREPSVSHVQIQQMIRSLDDEVRAHGAEAVHTFVHDVSAPNKTRSEVPSPEALFRTAVAPFLQQVWPQERSLVTPGVSQALAKVPAATRDAFAEAVQAIEPFLVPFPCWSLIDYGLYGEENGEPKLSSINSRDKAAALLRLLDLTIGTAEGSVIPHHLAEALDQVRRVAPNLAEGQVFRRLATAARRR